MIKRMVGWLFRTARIPRLLQIAAVLTLLALALMLWAVMVPTPMPVMLAMTFGQLLGTVAFASYGVAVALDLVRIRRERREAVTEAAPSSSSSSPSPSSSSPSSSSPSSSSPSSSPSSSESPP